MLPRISTALSTLIAPISASKSSQGQDFERAANQSKITLPDFSKRSPSRDPHASPDGSSGQNEPHAPAKVIALHPPGVAAENMLAAPAAPGQSLSVAHSLVLMLGMLKDQSRSLTQWMAVKAYRKATQTKRSAIRKGAMLDRRVG